LSYLHLQQRTLLNDVVILSLWARRNACVKNDHLKLELDVDTQLIKCFASWLVNCPTEDYGRRQGMYIHDQAHRNLTSLCHTTRNVEGGAGEAAFFTPFLLENFATGVVGAYVGCSSPGHH
jgi:hypothetical protein